MPYVGNGHLATTIFSDSIFVNGLYNGKLGKREEETSFFFHKIHDILFFSNTILGDSHRAKIPSIFAFLLHQKIHVMILLYSVRNIKN